MKRVSFQVDGETLHGDLHEPPGTRKEPVPLVVLAHGMSSSRQEWFDFPEKIARGGYAVFTFDFRGHGESDGERGLQSKERARADLEAALTAATNEFRIDKDRVALLGHSLGGALSICAAPHLPIKCLIALAPIRRLRDEMNLFEFLGYNLVRFLNPLVRIFHRRGLMVPYKVDYRRLYVDPAAIERARQAAFLQRLIPVKNYRPLVRKLDAARCAAEVKVPTLVMTAQYDIVVGKYNSRKVYWALAGPKKHVEVPASGHSMCGDARSDFVAGVCREWLDGRLKRR